MKGASQYQREIVQTVVNDLTKTIKILNEIDHNFASCEDVELEYTVVTHCKQLLTTTRDCLCEGE